MKKFALLLFIICLLSASCSEEIGGESSVAPVISADIVDSSESETSIGHISNGDSGLIYDDSYDNSVDCDNEADFFDDEPSVPIYYPSYKYSYEEFFAELDNDNLKPLKFENLKGVFDYVEIVCDPYFKGYYHFYDKTGSISVFSGKVVDSFKGVIERLKESGLTVEGREYRIYSSYEELDKYRDAADSQKIHCMNYKKEGVNIYAIQSGPNPKPWYAICFVLDGQLLSVSSPCYTYPYKYSAVNAGGLEQEYVYCKLRAKDEWGDFNNVNEALIELSDVTTESSALIRALKKAVADAK